MPGLGFIDGILWPSVKPAVCETSRAHPILSAKPAAPNPLSETCQTQSSQRNPPRPNLSAKTPAPNPVSETDSVQRPLCTQPSLHTALSAHSPLCTQPSLHTAVSAHNRLCTQPSLHRVLSIYSPVCAQPTLPNPAVQEYFRPNPFQTNIYSQTRCARILPPQPLLD